MPISPIQEDFNPSDPQQWWDRAKELNLDPRKMDITTYKPRSASKFNETDFIYLKALWRNRRATEFSIDKHVREQHIKAWEFLQFRKGQASPKQPDITPLQKWLREFILSASGPFTKSDPAKHMKLGAFMSVKSHLANIMGINDFGRSVAGDSPKIRRPSKVPRIRQKSKGTALTQQMGSLMLNQNDSGRPIAPTSPTPSPKGVSASTPEYLEMQELDVISPESMALEKDRSREEDSVNMALVLLLDTTTLCSGIRDKGDGRKGLSWERAQQSFQLGPASNPVCVARTDGLLVMEGDPCLTLAILEVKPYIRTSNQMRIEWQEACQMAAWISTSAGEKTGQKRKEGVLRMGASTKSGRKRVLISQDHIHLYLTIAEWGRNYEKYLYGKARPAAPPSPRGRKDAAPSPATSPTTNTQEGAAPTDDGLDGFLTMNCYGPYKVTDPEHMSMFLRNVLALMLELSDPEDPPKQ